MVSSINNMPYENQFDANYAGLPISSASSSIQASNKTANASQRLISRCIKFVAELFVKIGNFFENLFCSSRPAIKATPAEDAFIWEFESSDDEVTDDEVDPTEDAFIQGLDSTDDENEVDPAEDAFIWEFEPSDDEFEFIIKK